MLRKSAALPHRNDTDEKSISYGEKSVWCEILKTGNETLVCVGCNDGRSFVPQCRLVPDDEPSRSTQDDAKQSAHCGIGDPSLVPGQGQDRPFLRQSPFTHTTDAVSS